MAGDETFKTSYQTRNTLKLKRKIRVHGLYHFFLLVHLHLLVKGHSLEMRLNVRLFVFARTG